MSADQLVVLIHGVRTKRPATAIKTGLKFTGLPTNLELPIIKRFTRVGDFYLRRPFPWAGKTDLQGLRQG